MSLLYYPTCSSPDCDFCRVIGHSRDFYPGWMGFCKLCLKSVMLDEIMPGAPEFMPGLTIHRILRPNPERRAPRKRLKPSERRTLRQAHRAEGGARRLRQPDPPLFLETEAFLFVDDSGFVEGVDQGACPECGQQNGVQLGYVIGKTPCPKCGEGILFDLSGYVPMTLARRYFPGKQEHQVQPSTTFGFVW